MFLTFVLRNWPEFVMINLLAFRQYVLTFLPFDTWGWTNNELVFKFFETLVILKYSHLNIWVFEYCYLIFDCLMSVFLNIHALYLERNKAVMRLSSPICNVYNLHYLFSIFIRFLHNWGVWNSLVKILTTQHLKKIK